MAGLWEVWENDEQAISCVTILTTEPNDVMKQSTIECPVVLASEDEDRWLSADSDEREALCQPYSRDDLAAYEISTRVNNPSHDDPSVIEPKEHEQSVASLLHVTLTISGSTTTATVKLYPSLTFGYPEDFIVKISMILGSNEGRQSR